MAELALLVDNVVIHRFELDAEEIILGRSNGADIILKDNSVSSKHAKLCCHFEQGELASIVVHDLNSTNGTYVNGARITAMPLNNNDALSLGNKHFKLISERSSDATTLFTPPPAQAPAAPFIHAEQVKALTSLSKREHDVFVLIAQSQQRKAIARELNLSVHTVSDHIKTIYRKLSISSKQEAIALYQQSQLQTS